MPEHLKRNFLFLLLMQLVSLALLALEHKIDKSFTFIWCSIKKSPGLLETLYSSNMPILVFKTLKNFFYQPKNFYFQSTGYLYIFPLSAAENKDQILLLVEEPLGQSVLTAETPGPEGNDQPCSGGEVQGGLKLP